MDFNEDKLRSEMNKSKINPNAGLTIEEQLKSAFSNSDEPKIKATTPPKPAAIKSTPKAAKIKSAAPKTVAIKTSKRNRTRPLSNDIMKLIHRDKSGETLSVNEYCKKVIRLNETVTLGHVLAEEGKAFTDKSVLSNYGDSRNSVAHTMALCKVNQENFMLADKETLMLIGDGGNAVAHMIAKSDNVERMSFNDLEIFALRNDKGESVASLLWANGVKFTNKAFDSIRAEILNIIAA